MNVIATLDDSQIGDVVLEHVRRETTSAAIYQEAPTRVYGGFDTKIYGLRFRDTEPEWAQPLIARVFAKDRRPERAAFEAFVQNWLAGAGYPVAKVLLCFTDERVGAVNLMERLRGRVLYEDIARPSPRIFRVAPLLASTQARLHDLDASDFVRAMRSAGFDPESLALESTLARLEERVGAGMPGLIPGMSWLRSNKPSEKTGVICHCDFHPINILIDGAEVTGVIDWPNVRIGEAELDVGFSRVIALCGPAVLPPIVRPIFAVARRTLTWRYTRIYRKVRQLDSGRLAYYEALRCLQALVRVAEGRLAKINDDPYPWASVNERLLGHFRTKTGLELRLP